MLFLIVFVGAGEDRDGPHWWVVYCTCPACFKVIVGLRERDQSRRPGLFFTPGIRILWPKASSRPTPLIPLLDQASARPSAPTPTAIPRWLSRALCARVETTPLARSSEARGW